MGLMLCTLGIVSRVPGSGLRVEGLGAQCIGTGKQGLGCWVGVWVLNALGLVSRVCGWGWGWGLLR
jgi:hypothetical protein